MRCMRITPLIAIIVSVASVMSLSVRGALPPDEAGAKAALEKSPRPREGAELKVAGRDQPQKDDPRL